MKKRFILTVGLSLAASLLLTGCKHPICNGPSHVVPETVYTPMCVGYNSDGTCTWMQMPSTQYQTYCDGKVEWVDDKQFF